MIPREPSTFGDLARGLEARARLAGRTTLGWEPAELRVVFAREALPKSARARLLQVPGAALTPDPTTPALEELTAPAGAVRRLSTGDPSIACLYAAHRNATAEPLRARIMGVVNVTPDSFSDGGRFLDPDRAVEHGLELAERGADILDVGGESTRPGSEGVSAEVELDRVLPVISGLAERTSTPISVDTTKASVARAALDAGASMINDVGAGRLDPDMIPLAAERDCGLVLMHMRGAPRDMQIEPHYDDVVREILAFLRERVCSCLKAGVGLPRIAVDPGIGFGKRLDDNLTLIRATGELRSLGLPVLVGVSRKSFLSAITGAERQAEKPGETAAAVAAAVLFGAEIVRVHDVELMEPTMRVARALAGTTAPPERAGVRS